MRVDHLGGNIDAQTCIKAKQSFGAHFYLGDFSQFWSINFWHEENFEYKWTEKALSDTLHCSSHGALLPRHEDGSYFLLHQQKRLALLSSLNASQELLIFSGSQRLMLLLLPHKSLSEEKKNWTQVETSSANQNLEFWFAEVIFVGPTCSGSISVTQLIALDSSGKSHWGCLHWFYGFSLGQFVPLKQHLIRREMTLTFLSLKLDSHGSIDCVSLSRCWSRLDRPTDMLDSISFTLDTNFIELHLCPSRQTILLRKMWDRGGFFG